MNKAAEAKVTQAVGWYRREHADEYAAFVEQMRIARESSVSGFAEVDGSPGHRMLHEMPETMWDYLLDLFDVEEITWFSTKEANHWFAKEFPEFSVARSI